MADELYQEFFLAICETTDNRLVEAYDGKYLDVLCVGIINNIWGKRDRVKSYDKGATHPLYEMTSNIWFIDETDQQDEPYNNYHKDGRVHSCTIEGGINEYDYDKDQKVQQANEFIKELVEIKKESPNQSDRFRARVFHHSNFTYKNTRQFSKISGIPYNVCWEANHKFKQLIKINLNGLRPDSGF